MYYSLFMQCKELHFLKMSFTGRSPDSLGLFLNGSNNFYDGYYAKDTPFKIGVKIEKHKCQSCPTWFL